MRGAGLSWRSLLEEPRRPPSIRNRPNAHWLVVATVCIGAFMGQLDASIVTLAFPTLKQDFHSTVGAVQWVGLTYLLVLVGLVTAVGRMADMVGRKLLYTYGFVVFLVGSGLCGVSTSLGMLDGLRVLQGVGAAMLQANSVAIIASSVPREQLGRAIGVQGAAQALGLSLGPMVGGFLIGIGGWRLIFLINVPVGVIGTVLGWFLIPRSRELAGRTRFDWWGLGLFFPAVCGLLLALSFGHDHGWASPVVVGGLTAAVVLGAAFLRRERATSGPMIDLELFRRPAFSAGIGSGLLSYLVLFGALFVVPFFLESALHLSPARAGLELTAIPLALGLAAPLAGRAADRLGARPLTVGGMALCAASLSAMALSHAATGAVVAELAALGAGLGAFTPPNNAAIMGAAPRAHSGMASGVLNMTRGLGTALGLAATGAVLGAVGGARLTTGGAISRGFTGSCVFLAGVSVVALVIAGLRGQAPLVGDPDGPQDEGGQEASLEWRGL